MRTAALEATTRRLIAAGAGIVGRGAGSAAETRQEAADSAESYARSEKLCRLELVAVFVAMVGLLATIGVMLVFA